MFHWVGGFFLLSHTYHKSPRVILLTFLLRTEVGLWPGHVTHIVVGGRDITWRDSEAERFRLFDYCSMYLKNIVELYSVKISID